MCRSDLGVICVELCRGALGGSMDATEQNILVLVVVLGFAGVGALLVAVLSSRSLREQGLKRLMKRWLG